MGTRRRTRFEAGLWQFRPTTEGYEISYLLTVPRGHCDTIVLPRPKKSQLVRAAINHTKGMMKSPCYNMEVSQFIDKFTLGECWIATRIIFSPIEGIKFNAEVFKDRVEVTFLNAKREQKPRRRNFGGSLTINFVGRGTKS